MVAAKGSLGKVARSLMVICNFASKSNRVLGYGGFEGLIAFATIGENLCEATKLPPNHQAGGP